VSKRPRTATGMVSRLHRPVGRLRDLPIWSKLGLIMIVPTLATIVVGTNGLVDHIATANNADRARTLSSLSADVGLLVHRLQDERAAATLLLNTRDPAAVQKNTGDYQKRFGETDQAKSSYQLRRTGLADLPTSFKTLLERIDTQISELPNLRQDVATRKDVSLSYAAFFYRVLIADLLAIRDSSAQLAGETSLNDRMRAAAAISSMKEYLSQERIVVLRAFGDEQKEPLPDARRRDFVAALTGQEQAFASFLVVATSPERTLFDQEMSGDDLRLAEKYEGAFESILNGGKLEDLKSEFDAPKWDAAMRDRADLLRKVESALDREMEEQATILRDDVQRQVLVETGLLLGMLLLAILFAWLVARSMARSLRELRHGALSVAQYGLPQAVNRLRDPALTTQLSPMQIATQIAEPLPVRSRDEFGQVTEAFNRVHMEAVRTAAEQAALRSSVATMFVNLARRSQLLVDRLIGHLDRLERGEEDPDRLAELFQLDHLATRMRRNDENLLVLAGADSTRVQREPAALSDVLRAAQSEVEHYTRIEFGVIDRDIEVGAHAVNDVVHLVAELLDNATSFSPPDSSVFVEARRVGDRAVLLVEDRGIGIMPEQLSDLNERLSTPPTVDVAVSRMMGLVVVARLASRHGIRVELRSAPERGTIADVMLPPTVLVPRALAGRLRGGSIDMLGRGGSGQSRNPVGPPLALESGPSAGARPPEQPARAFDSGPFDRTPPLSQRPMDDPRGPTGPTGPGAGSRPPMPAWSDLTGASGANGASAGPLSPPAQDPLPQRKPGDSRIFDGEVMAGSPPPPESRTNGARSSGREDFGPPPASAPSGGLRSGGAPPPPAWPPPPPSAETSDNGGPPAVPEQFAAALDMTAEIPRVRGEDGAAAAEQTTGYGSAPDSRPRFVDETMELPIFRELESAWFRTRRSVPEEGASSAASPRTQPGGDRGPVSAGRGPSARTEAPAGTDYHTEAAGREAASAGVRRVPAQDYASWESAADDGWRAATAAAESRASDVTGAGLPKRVPMAQLVPGGVDKNANTSHRRTPEAVRGLLSAYHRGVQRGRSQPRGLAPDGASRGSAPDGGTAAEGRRPDLKTPERTTTGSQSSQAGKEQDG